MEKRFLALLGMTCVGDPAVLGIAGVGGTRIREGDGGNAFMLEIAHRGVLVYSDAASLFWSSRQRFRRATTIG